MHGQLHSPVERGVDEHGYKESYTGWCHLMQIELKELSGIVARLWTLNGLRMCVNICSGGFMHGHGACTRNCVV